MFGYACNETPTLMPYAIHLAKNIVASGAAEKCMVQLAYAIGKAEPVSLMVDFIGTGNLPEARVHEYISKNIDLTPVGIIDRLRLKLPVYLKTASYGHFGREIPEFTWEVTDLADQIKNL